MGDSILGGQSIVTRHRGGDEGPRAVRREQPRGVARDETVRRGVRGWAGSGAGRGADPGVDSLANLSPAQRVYARRCARSWRRTRSACAGTPWRRSGLYKKGIYAYSKGMYPDSVKWQEAALAETDPELEARRRHPDPDGAGVLRVRAEGSRDRDVRAADRHHPEGSVKKQAEELKYIQRRRRWRLARTRRCEVPLLRDDYGGYRDKWGHQRGGNEAGRQEEKSLEEMYGEEVEPIVGSRRTRSSPSPGR